MTPFRVHILGCGSAMPTLRHNPSSQVVEIREKLFMIDCGEGTQVQLRRSRLGFTKVNALFVSHLHGDHCLGIIGMISTFGMLGRTAPFHIYATPEFKRVLDVQMQIFCQNLEFDVVFHPVDTTKRQIIYEDRSIAVKTIPLRHRIPCCGYLFSEKPTLPHIRRDMIDFYKIPLSQINNIKNGTDWTDEDGNRIPNARLTRPSDKPRSYAYCSDTIYMPDLYKTVRGVNTLYHESTYLSKEEKMAALYYHSTAAQAAKVANEAEVSQLIIGHFSARYEDATVLLDEAKKTFEHTILAKEGLIVDV